MKNTRAISCKHQDTTENVELKLIIDEAVEKHIAPLMELIRQLSNRIDILVGINENLTRSVNDLKENKFNKTKLDSSLMSTDSGDTVDKGAAAKIARDKRVPEKGTK